MKASTIWVIAATVFVISFAHSCGGNIAKLNRVDDCMTRNRNNPSNAITCIENNL